MTVEEAIVAPHVMDGMCYLFIMLINLCLLMILFMLGTFPVNSIHALLMFDLGASRSFVSSSFCCDFSIRREALCRPLRISIPDEHPVFATNVYRGCVLEIFGVGYLIDLIPILMGYICVIVGTDWLIHFGDLSDCERNLVTV